MDYFAIFGSPIAHSLSPQIHEIFAKQLGMTLRYERIETHLGQLSTALAHFHQHGGKGANITLPLKKEAFALCDYHFKRAQQAEAVNTLMWDKKGLLWGDNTDGEGLVSDLIINKKIALKDKNLLILGAGGATQGILPSLAPLCANIVIVNRTLEKAATLSRPFNRVTPFTYETLNTLTEPFDIVINATSSSLHQTVPPLTENWIKSTIAVDLTYYLHEETYFMTWAKAHGAKETYDGLGMLVEQAALAFERWYDEKPNTLDVIQTLATI